MKKLYLFLIVAILFGFLIQKAEAGVTYFGTSDQAVQFIKASGEGNNSKALGIGQCVFCGIWVATDGTNDVVVNVYDSATATGKKLIPSITIPGESMFGGAILEPGVLVNTDIYVSVTTSGTVSWQVYFDNGR